MIEVGKVKIKMSPKKGVNLNRKHSTTHKQEYQASRKNW